MTQFGRHAVELPEDEKKQCAVHHDEINHFSWCDNFDYCATGWAAGADYTCHTAEDCAEYGCKPHSETEEQNEG